MRKRTIWIIIFIFLVLSLFCYSSYKPEPESESLPFTISEEIRPIATVERQGHPLYLFTIFFPEFLYVKEAQLPRRDAIDFWNRVASQDACNGTRLFIGHTSWAGKYEAWIEKPFSKDGSGEYILPGLNEDMEDYINPEWKRLFLARLKILRDREIFRSIDIWDFCQMHHRYNSSWDTHWLKQINSDPQQAFNIHSQSFKYVEKFTRYVVSLIWAEEVKHIRPRWNTSLGFNPGNEVPPNKQWHDRICEIVNEEIDKITPGVEMYRWQMIGSALPYDSLPLGIDDNCLYQLHQVNSLETYNRLKHEIIIQRFMASLDGARDENGDYFLIKKSEALKLINQIIIDKNYGLELRVAHGEPDRLPSASNGWKYDLSVINLDVSCAVVKKYKESFQN